jgi:periplasmic copper chaperone A
MATRVVRGLVCGVVLAAATAVSSQPEEAKVRVDSAWARRAVMIRSNDANAFTGTGAVYATLVNAGPKSDALVAVATDAAGVAEIHETFEESGLSRMRQVARLDVAPGAKSS